MVLEGGALLVGADGSIEAASDGARALLCCREPEDLRSSWVRIKGAAGGALDGHRFPGSTSAPVDVDVEVEGRSRRLRLWPHRRSDGSAQGVLVLIQDRDAAKLLVGELGLAARMRALHRVALALVHDLKAPLNAMMFNVELLKQLIDEVSLGRDQEARHVRYAAVLREEILRMSRSLDALLKQISIPSAEREAFDARELVRDVAAWIAAQAKHQQVLVETRFPEEPVRVSSRRDLLEAALVHLAVSALEAMPKGGRLDLGLETNAEECRIWVGDSGEALAPDPSERLWEIDFSRKGARSGLGVVRSLVESLGARIAVDAAPDRGIRFVVTVPLDSGHY